MSDFIDTTCAVGPCQAAAQEAHHWAPKAIFHEQADDWPMSKLCSNHHREWHLRVQHGPGPTVVGTPVNLWEPPERRMLSSLADVWPNGLSTDEMKRVLTDWTTLRTIREKLIADGAAVEIMMYSGLRGRPKRVLFLAHPPVIQDEVAAS